MVSEREGGRGNDIYMTLPLIYNLHTGRCPVEVNGGIQWPWTLEGTTAFRPCSEAGSMFRVGPRASRQCDQEGEWKDADLTSCTITDVEEPFILVWFVIDAEEYTDSMEQDFIDNVIYCTQFYMLSVSFITVGKSS